MGNNKIYNNSNNNNDEDDNDDNNNINHNTVHEGFFFFFLLEVKMVVMVVRNIEDGSDNDCLVGYRKISFFFFSFFKAVNSTGTCSQVV